MASVTPLERSERMTAALLVDHARERGRDLLAEMARVEGDLVRPVTAGQRRLHGYIRELLDES